MAGRGAGNHGEPFIQIAIQIFAKCAKGPGMGINQACTHDAIGGQAKFGRTLFGQIADQIANTQCLAVNSGLAGEIIKADLIEKYTIPWIILMGQIGPFCR